MALIETPRLLLQDFVPGDAAELFELYRRPETSRYESWSPHREPGESRRLLEFWIGQQDARPRRSYTLAIRWEERFVGLAGLDLGFGTETDDPRCAFAGYRIHPDRWGRGLATEALLGLLSFAFDELGLHRVHTGCATENRASLRVIQKAGFRLEGLSRASFPVDGDWYDYQHAALLREEYLRRRRDGVKQMGGGNGNERGADA